ncbi:hypothetical protein PYCCODRAFT_1358875 [Trametes coccinea BRFM310]|uniref:Protein kinase domain-containing protein n=1 Tax=Trametes coccinea (strain BRFM310) TaxID=1353009 RepID=A0A1Y2J223_TRAC3|nr:hypothetical protein PYCCODRAFT_1358875 [Trametes coccinea BRFM310]
MLPPPQPPQEATDIFSISDQVLADRLQFIEEIGFGNWGSVWLCRPKPSSSSQDPVRENKIAVKLVHRSKTSTTAARVRSLWNEMKVVRSLKHEPHPSIIPFYSFIITPSYALITMAYHPRLITVEVSEPHAKEWFRSLLSGVEFLHKRGVVHNDIKPANILLSNENVPVLVDFGFAERYDLDKPDAFHSNLSYGTPEYLSPERARGLPHDTRKSDVWSLGVTFFEILVGRTPFEAADGAETFATKDDLERYWARTLRGKWVGTWAMSRGAEKLLRRMVLPNADLRCTAEEAMRDAYWTSNEGEKEPAAKAHHRKSASVSHSRTSSLILDREMSKLLDVIPPWSSRANKDKERAAKAEKEREKEKERIAAKENKHKENKDKENKDKQPKDRERVKFATLAGKENAPRPPAAGKVFAADKEKDAAETTRGHARSYSQPKLQVLDGASAPASRGVNQTRRQTGVVPSVFAAFSPLKHDPPAPPPTPSLFVSPFGEAGENRPAKAAVAASSKPAARTTRRPLGPRGPSSPNASKENICRESPASAQQQHEKRRSSQILRDVTSARKHDENVSRAGGGVRRAESKTLKSERSAREVRGAGADASVESKAPSVSGADTSKDSVRSRMKEWERERERLREMERLRMREVEETETETENESERESEQGRDPAGVREVERKSEQDRKREVSPQPEREREREREYFLPKISVGPPLSPTASVHPATPLSPLFEEPSQPVESPTDALPDDSAHETGFSALKQSFRLSLGGAVRLYKSSTQLLGRSTPALTLGSDNVDEEESRMSLSPRASWEDEVLPPKSESRSEEQLAEEKKMDRMTLWIQSVEKVVDEARQNFAASTTSGPLPPLPVAPISRRSSSCNRSARANRVPRKILPANQIFVNEYESGVFDRSVLSASTSSPASPLPSPSFLNTMNFADHSLPTIPSEMPSRVEHGSERDRSRSCAAEHEGASRGGGAVALAVPETPSRRRRATVVTRSPETKRRPPSLEIDVSPSKRREKSKSHSELVRPITPITKLEFELERLAQPTPTPRLSTVVDKSLFIATSPAHKVPEEPEVSMRSTPPRQKDDLTASPLHVEPYPARPVRTTVALDTPAKRHLEGVYDRFLMSTTGVRRNGKGYQSDNGGPVGHVAAPRPHSSMAKRSQKFKFHTARRPMPPPVSSDDLRRASSVDEFGTFCPSQSTPAPAPAAGAEHNKNTIAVVRKAFKAIVTGKPTARSAKPIWV